MPKDSLRDKLEGNDLDLSLGQLEVVPVKELAALPKATNIDLSCNKLTILPDLFCTLTHIYKLDLSKNQLTELPKNFGELHNLQHLDLLENNLTTLPRSFCQLRKLRWLDLKDNPLEEGLKKNAGDCLDESQCKKCAARILMYMTDLDAIHEEQYQKKLKKQRAAEERAKEKEEREQLRKRQEKKAEKERRRKERETMRAQEISAQSGDTSDEDINREKEKMKNKGGFKAGKKGTGVSACITLVLFSFLVLIIALLVAIDFHCNASQKDQLCITYWHPARQQALSTWLQSKIYVQDFYHKHVEKYFAK